MKHHINILLVAAVAILMLPVSGVADVPQMINYQGRLTDSFGEPLNATVNMVFSICSDSTGSACSWTEVHPGVVVSEGLFDVVLGSVTPISDENFSGPERWLGITVGEEVLPYTRLVSAPYAYHASAVDGFSPGPENNDSGLNTLVAGDSNTVLSDYSTIAGGYGNLVDLINFSDTVFDTTDCDTIGISNLSTLKPQDSRLVQDNGAILGGYNNTVHGFASAVVHGWGNHARGAFTFIGGGFRNVAGNETNEGGTVGGGARNLGTGYSSVIGGGIGNEATGHNSTVGGGQNNKCHGCGGTIGGGVGNRVTGCYSCVPGGFHNHAKGFYSFAAGTSAKAAHAGSVVISAAAGPAGADSVWSSAGEQMVLRADSGLYITNMSQGAPHDTTKFINTVTGAYLTSGGTWTDNSSREKKEDSHLLDGELLLDKVADMPVESWRYKNTQERHIGPVAEDFVAAFDVGTPNNTGKRDDKHLSSSDVAGVALAGVQALLAKNEKL